MKIFLLLAVTSLISQSALALQSASLRNENLVAFIDIRKDTVTQGVKVLNDEKVERVGFVELGKRAILAGMPSKKSKLSEGRQFTTVTLFQNNHHTISIELESNSGQAGSLFIISKKDFHDVSVGVDHGGLSNIYLALTGPIAKEFKEVLKKLPPTVENNGIVSMAGTKSIYDLGGQSFKSDVACGKFSILSSESKKDTTSCYFYNN